MNAPKPKLRALHRHARPGVLSSGERPAARDAAERDALMRVAAAAAGAYRLEDVLEQTAEAALDATGAASLSISRWKREEELMQTLINVGELGPGEERFPSYEVYPLTEHPLVARLLTEQRPYHVAVDDPDASAEAVELLRVLGKESDLAVPVIVDGEVWGEVWAATKPGTRRFDAGDVRFLEAIAGQLALVLDRAERYSQVSQLAYEDPLTGLANRRAVEERLDQLLPLGETSEQRLTVILCDVDGLKAINDQNGHDAGDRVLCRVADVLVRAVEDLGPSLVGRLAGDEFCIVLEDGNVGAAGEMARVALDLLADGGEGIPLSVSFGAANATAESEPGDLLRAADIGQYAAKRRGGGRLCTAGSGVLPNAPLPRGLPKQHELEVRLESAAEELLRLLDAEMAGQSGLDRMEAVAVGFVTALNGAAWSISRWKRGDEVLRLLSTADDRDNRLRGVRIGVEHEIYRLVDYPETARLLEDERGGFLVAADDDQACPAERRLLDELGLSAALVAVASDDDGVYLAEIYGDEWTAEMTSASARLQLLLRVAVADSVGLRSQIARAS